MRILHSVFVTLTLVTSACSSSENTQTSEPIAPEQEPAPAFADGTPSDIPPPEASAETPPEQVPPSASSETIGELTDPHAQGSGEPQPETSLPPTESTYSDAPSVPDQPAMEDAGLGKGTRKSARKHRGKAEKNRAKGASVTRFVNVANLNVRSKPSLKASIVRQLSFGTPVEAECKGKFCKIGEGEWVRSKHLTAKSPKKSSKGRGKGGKKKSLNKATDNSGTE